MMNNNFKLTIPYHVNYEGIKLTYNYDFNHKCYEWTDESLEKLLNHLYISFDEAFKVLEANKPTL